MSRAVPRAPEIRSESPSCWVVTEGMAGTENPCLGLAEALGLCPAVKRIRVRAPWRWLPAPLQPAPLRGLSVSGDRLAPPWPDLLIASGRKAVAPALAIRRAAGGACFAVFVQNPRVDPARFDAVVAPEHDRVRGANVIRTLGGLTRVSAGRLAEARTRFADLVAELPHPRVAVLVGGRAAGKRLTRAGAARLGGQLRGLAADTGAGLMVTTSRRTGAANVRALRQALAGVPHRFHAPDRDPGENPYWGFLAHAEHVLVTDDSVSMASEAASLGVPVHLVALAGGRAKLARFHDRLQAFGVARWFDGTLARWTPPELDETARAAAEIRRIWQARLAPPSASS